MKVFTFSSLVSVWK